MSMQDDLSIESAQADIQREMEELPALLEEADAETAQNEATFDSIYQSKAESVAFMASHDTGFEATNAKMSEYKDLLGVDNVLIVDRDGGVVARAQDTLADFSYQRYNLLRTVFDTDEPSASMEVEFADEGVTMRYYAARIDGDSMVVRSFRTLHATWTSSMANRWSAWRIFWRASSPIFVVACPPF